jgi:hypothetical protein
VKGRGFAFAAERGYLQKEVGEPKPDQGGSLDLREGAALRKQSTHFFY